MTIQRQREIAARYLRYRALCEDRKGRPHVASSERYVAERVLLGLCDDGQTMRRLAV